MKNEAVWLRRVAAGAAVVAAVLIGTAVFAPELLAVAIVLVVFVLASSMATWLLSHFRRP